MISKIKLSYPTFGTDGLELEHEFTKWINIIEWENGYGKSTILNTIMSLYTGNYPNMRTLPEGSAVIEQTLDKYVLSKKNWIGIQFTPSELYNYCVVGKFFDLPSTVKQREVLVKLLGLDMEEFIKTKCEALNNPLLAYVPDLEKNLNTMLKDFETREALIIEDIQRLEKEIIDAPVKEFNDITEYYENKKKQVELVNEYNKGIYAKTTLIQAKNNESNKIKLDLSSAKQELEYTILSLASKHKEIESLRTEFLSLDPNDCKCTTCNQTLPVSSFELVKDNLKAKWIKAKEELAVLQTKHAELITKIEKLEAQVLTLSEPEPYPQPIATDSLDVETLTNFTFPKITAERLQEQKDYEASLQQIEIVKRELELKKNQLKSIDTLKVQNAIDSLKDIKKQFTKLLNEKTKELPIQIELYKEQKNWELKESFTIIHNGMEYSTLSHGNKMIVQILLAKIFIDKLGLDFILVDEASSIDKDNAKYIADLSKNYQIILAKASNWTKSTFK